MDFIVKTQTFAVLDICTFLQIHLHVFPLTLPAFVLEFNAIKISQGKNVNGNSEKSFVNAVDSHRFSEGFIKVTDSPLGALSSEQKVALNRKGNELFNGGKIQEASRIFITTGYSDGLTRVGDFFSKNNQSLKALKFYILAKNKKKCEVIYEKIAKVISILEKE